MNTIDQQISQAHHLWPTITEEQRRQDVLVRTEQAAGRRLTDEALKEGGREWISGSVNPQEPIHDVPGEEDLRK